MSGPKIAIIGGGPAGMAAAIQLKRYDLNPTLFEPDELGGLLRNAWKVENYLGFPEPLSGAELIERFKEQFEQYDIEVRKERIELLEFYDTVNRFEIRTAESSFSPDYVICATGTKPIRHNLIENASEKCRERIFYEVYPILKEEGKRIAIIGAGDAAYDYAMSLADKNEVIIINRTEEISALPKLQKYEKKSDSITYCENVSLVRIGSADRDRLNITIAKFGEQWLLEVDYLIAAIGREPNSDIYSEKFIKKEAELIKKDVFYPVGDLKNGNCRQVSIAIGDGICAAMKIYNRIKALKHELSLYTGRE